jgi:quinohemoprotein amine dehydrogenase
MAPTHRAVLPLAALAVLALSAPLQAQDEPDGYRVENETVIDACSRCHRMDDEGRMTRISFLRKTPEGWQTSVRRMAALHDVAMTPEQARDIVRYLANEQGIAPEELRPALFEVERRMIDHDWDGDSGVEFTCIQCHSMGRIMTQRRPKEEWSLLLATHRGLYPLVDFQAFRRPGPAPTEPDEDGRPPDTRHPMDKAIDHLSARYPLETAEWSTWSANKRSPQLAGSWAMSGYEPGMGPVFGTVTITANTSDDDAFTTAASYVYPESGERVTRSGSSLVYTGYQWRGRSNPGASDELREVMFVERDQRTIHGRWFSGAYDEMGPDVRLQRVGATPVVAGVYPGAVPSGGTTAVTIYGGNLPSNPGPSDLDFGAGVTVQSIEVGGGVISVTLAVEDGATVGSRDLFAFGEIVESAITVHDGIDRIEVTPETGMARIGGGGSYPKGYQTFEAMGYDNGPDGDPNTDDDLMLGRVNAGWSVEEYTATYDDDDISYVGQMDRETGVFTPALDGPNPDRKGMRNNVGDVWAIATYTTDEGVELRARAHLLVTVPLYMRFEPWRPTGR